jgi:hypothetical protein
MLALFKSCAHTKINMAAAELNDANIVTTL